MKMPVPHLSSTSSCIDPPTAPDVYERCAALCPVALFELNNRINTDGSAHAHKSPHPHNHSKEVFIIPLAHTLVQEWAVVVKAGHTLVASAAMIPASHHQ